MTWLAAVGSPAPKQARNSFLAPAFVGKGPDAKTVTVKMLGPAASRAENQVWSCLKCPKFAGAPFMYLQIQVHHIICTVYRGDTNSLRHAFEDAQADGHSVSLHKGWQHFKASAHKAVTGQPL